MTTQKFSTLYLNNLRINDLFSLNKSTIEYANPVSESIGAIAAATLTQLISDNEAMGLQMNKPTKNMLTQQLVDSDQDRDDRFAEIKRNITTNIKGRDEAKKTAAQNLKGFFAPYWDVDKKAMNTETGVFAEMLGKYNANESLKADAAAIGIADMLTGLETANNDFDALYRTRNSDEAQNGPSATSLKSTAAKSYEQFCTAIEQAVNFASTDVLTTLFGQMDELRKTYAALNGRKKQEEEAPEEATETE